jgi:hypothetical protein
MSYNRRFLMVLIGGLIFVLLVVIALFSPQATTTTHATSTVRPGDVIVAHDNSICGSSVQAYDDMVKWAVRGDEREMLRVLVLTGSSMWTTGSQAKVLDVGGFMFSRTKIRILETQRECWVPSEAAGRAGR